MPIEHETKVKTKDGHEAGHIKHAIWDANGRRITEYVIATGGLLGHDVVVSPELLEGAPRKGNEIVLNIDKHELDELAHYESAEYAHHRRSGLRRPFRAFRRVAISSR